MVDTRTSSTMDTDLTYILAHLLGRKAGSDIHLAFDNHNITTIIDVMALSFPAIDKLDYPVVESTTVTTYKPLKQGDTALIIGFQYYIAHCTNSGTPILDFQKVDKGSFTKYMMSRAAFHAVLPPSKSPAINPVDNFKRGIKKDASVFPILKKES